MGTPGGIRGQCREPEPRAGTGRGWCIHDRRALGWREGWDWETGRRAFIACPQNETLARLRTDWAEFRPVLGAFQRFRGDLVGPACSATNKPAIFNGLARFAR